MIQIQASVGQVEVFSVFSLKSDRAYLLSKNWLALYLSRNVLGEIEMVEWEFVLNNKPMSKLKGMGLSLDAFSGMEGHINKCEAACLRNVGPIPPGAYYIVDRPSGGLLGGLNTWIKRRSGWFGLFAIDNKIDDYVFCNEVLRGSFRLHPKGPLGISEGCITLESENDFLTLSRLLLKQEPYQIPGTTLSAYGKVNVRCGNSGA